jgi:hypothetical protein
VKSVVTIVVIRSIEDQLVFWVDGDFSLDNIVPSAVCVDLKCEVMLAGINVEFLVPTRSERCHLVYIAFDTSGCSIPHRVGVAILWNRLTSCRYGRKEKKRTHPH